VRQRSTIPRAGIAAIAACIFLAACHSRAPRAQEAANSSYRPAVRELTVTTVPLLVREQSGTFPFLKGDFARGGVLDGKEVYAFSPSTLTVIAGDTIHFTFINPEDDVHSFVLPDLAVPLPPQSITHATYVAAHPGVFQFVCSVASHLPMMSGQLVVLAPPAEIGSETGS
jgi:plastocyanin